MPLFSVQWSPRKDLGLTIKLHPSISRTHITTPGGDIELLCAAPASYDTSKPPLLFVHGGFGAATEYRYFLEYFSSRGYPSYAISVRGHGNSYSVNFWKMLFTSQHQMALDVTAGIHHVIDKHRNEGRPNIVPVGHSAGGALLQYILSEGLHSSPDPGKTDSQTYVVGRVGLLGVIPCSGSAGIYWKWVKVDPSYPLRMYLFHFGHPRSPLSSTRLVKQAFFCDECPDERVREFETQEMAPYESVRWPLGTLTAFADPKRMVQAVGLTNSSGCESTEDLRPRVLVIAGGKDILMNPGLMAKLVGLLRNAVRLVFGSVANEADAQEGVEDGVEFRVVQGSGHHLMGDIYWEECAGRILRFLE
jgi:pimeloyl-ACP methyl ester carboxylesterase